MGGNGSYRGLSRTALAFAAGFVSVSLSPSTAAGATLFSWNADSVSPSSSCTALNSATLDGLERHDGTNSMKVTIPGNAQGAFGCPGAPPVLVGSGSDGGWLYFRWWMKMGSNFTWGGGSPKMQVGEMKRQGDLTPIAFQLWIDPLRIYVGTCKCQQGDAGVHDDPSAAVVYYDFDPKPNPAVANWQEYIVGLRMQSGVDKSDGEFHLWVNGVQEGTGVKGMSYCNADAGNCVGWVQVAGSMMVSPSPQLGGDASSGGTIWLDDFSFDDVWNSSISAVDGGEDAGLDAGADSGPPDSGTADSGTPDPGTADYPANSSYRALSCGCSQAGSGVALLLALLFRLRRRR